MRTGDMLGFGNTMSKMLATAKAGKHPLEGVTSLSFGTRRMDTTEHPRNEYAQLMTTPAVELFMNEEYGHIQQPTNKWPILELAWCRRDGGRYSSRIIMFRMSSEALYGCNSFIQEGPTRHLRLGASTMDGQYECPLRALNRFLSIGEEPYYDMEEFPLAMYWGARSFLESRGTHRAFHRGDVILAPYVPKEYDESTTKYKILRSGADILPSVFGVGSQDEIGIVTRDGARHMGFDALLALYNE